MNKPTVVVIVGPTASGKTSLSLELAKRLDGEIVSADSMQIYCGMDIATAKPSQDELNTVPHHMIGFLPADQSFSVASYKKMAVEAIDEIISRGKQPVVVGGTGLYIDTLVNNTEFFDYDKSDIRQSLIEKSEKEGIEVLFKELLRVDPETAEKLHLNDSKRIIRALEVYYSTGRTISEQRECSHMVESKYNWCILGINANDRQLLYDRINQRVDIMVESGLIQEADEFFRNDCSGTAKQAIGYKELKPYFDGNSTLEQALERLKMETRRYAKRQLTWFRKNEKINWLYIDSALSENLADQAMKIIDEFGR